MDNQVYVSFERDEYKIHKSTLLKAKSGIISLQKRILTLKAIRAQKKRNHAILEKIMQAIAMSSAKLDERLPEFKMPAELKPHMERNKKVEKKVIKIEKVERKKQPEDYLEDELMEINRKLRELNS